MDVMTKERRDAASSAKAWAVDQFADDDDVTSIGVGLTEDLKDYAVTITVSKNDALARLPEKIGDVSVRKIVSGYNEFY